VTKWHPTHGSVPTEINAHIDLPKVYRRYRKEYKLRHERRLDVRRCENFRIKRLEIEHEKLKSGLNKNSVTYTPGTTQRPLGKQPYASLY
jgi:hypothetical protein